MTYIAHIGYIPAPELLAYLRNQLSPTVTLTVGDDLPANAQALVAGRPTSQQLAASPALRLLLIPFAGLPAVTRQRLTDYPHIAVHNLHHNATPTAEMALGLMFAAARGLIPAHNMFRDGDWTARYSGKPPAVILEGKTALVLGYGEVGRRIGTACRALGMRVLGVRRRPSSEPDVFTPDALPDLLPQANVLFIALPETNATEGLLNADAINRLPDGAILINTGRASIVDEAALFQALANGKLHSAGLDVWYIYPPDEGSRTHTHPADHPFWALPNVVMSPHRGGGLHNPEVERARMDGIAAALNAAAAGLPVPHPLTPDQGY